MNTNIRATLTNFANRALLDNLQQPKNKYYSQDTDEGSVVLVSLDRYDDFTSVTFEKTTKNGTFFASFDIEDEKDPAGNWITITNQSAGKDSEPPTLAEAADILEKAGLEAAEYPGLLRFADKTADGSLDVFVYEYPNADEPADDPLLDVWSRNNKTGRWIKEWMVNEKDMRSLYARDFSGIAQRVAIEQVRRERCSIGNY